MAFVLVFSSAASCSSRVCPLSAASSAEKLSGRLKSLWGPEIRGSMMGSLKAAPMLPATGRLECKALPHGCPLSDTVYVKQFYLIERILPLQTKASQATNLSEDDCVTPYEARATGMLAICLLHAHLSTDRRQAAPSILSMVAGVAQDALLRASATQAG